jgi:hypothetical protein
MIRALIAAALLLCACGEEADPAKPKLTGDKRAAADVAEKYAHAIAAKDWKTACATRTQAERRTFAQNFGTCEKALATVFKDKPVESLSRVQARTVNIADGVAGVTLVQPGGLSRLKVAAVRDHGEWRLKDIPDEQIP